MLNYLAFCIKFGYNILNLTRSGQISCPLLALSRLFGGIILAKVKQICEEKLKDVIQDMGYELVDVSYEKENGSMSLIFTIDKDGGVTVDDCESVSKKINPMLDEINPTDDQPYTLVVSSPGLDRPLKTDRDFKRALDKDVEVTLFAKQNGKKKFSGLLINFDEKNIVLKTQKEDLVFEREKIASIKLDIKF